MQHIRWAKPHVNHHSGFLAEVPLLRSTQTLGPVFSVSEFGRSGLGRRASELAEFSMEALNILEVQYDTTEETELFN